MKGDLKLSSIKFKTPTTTTHMPKIKRGGNCRCNGLVTYGYRELYIYSGITVTDVPTLTCTLCNSDVLSNVVGHLVSILARETHILKKAADNNTLDFQSVVSLLDPNKLK